MPNKPSGTPAHRRWVGAESENKPTATPERPKGAFRCEVTRRVSAANLEHVRFGEKSIVCSFRKISHAQHRNSPKDWFGAECRRVRREEQIPRRKIPFFGAEFASAIPRPVSVRTRVEGMSLAESLCPLAGRDFQRRLAARPAAQPVDAAIWMLNPPVNPSTSSISPQR